MNTMDTMKSACGGRLESLDALRGFDMLLIMGFGPVVIALCGLFGFGESCWLARQFEHVEWNGLRLEDTIFPLFLFLAGVAWPFSHARQREAGKTTGAIVWKCVKRAAILFALGLVYGGLLRGNLRMGSVLGRIGVAWMVGAFLHMTFRVRTLAILALLIPIAYWLLICFVPAPDALTLVIPEDLAFVRDYGTGPYSIVGNLSGWVERHFVPGVLQPYTGIADNQSVLGYVPAVGTALLGILSGEFLRSSRAMRPVKRIGLMVLAAAALAALGLAIATCFGEMSMPINKKLWSASFTFVVGGYSVAMLALFHGVVDVLGWKRWTFFFRVIGMNSIFIYMAMPILGLSGISKYLFAGLVSLLPVALQPLGTSVAFVATCWLLLYFLYRKKVFFKV